MQTCNAIDALEAAPNLMVNASASMATKQIPTNSMLFTVSFPGRESLLMFIHNIGWDFGRVLGTCRFAAIPRKKKSSSLQPERISYVHYDSPYAESDHLGLPRVVIILPSLHEGREITPARLYPGWLLMIKSDNAGEKCHVQCGLISSII